MRTDLELGKQWGCVCSHTQQLNTHTMVRATHLPPPLLFCFFLCLLSCRLMTMATANGGLSPARCAPFPTVPCEYTFARKAQTEGSSSTPLIVLFGLCSFHVLCSCVCSTLTVDTVQGGDPPDPSESRLFWWSLYLFTLMWGILGLFALIRLRLSYFVSWCECMCLCGCMSVCGCVSVCVWVCVSVCGCV